MWGGSEAAVRQGRAKIWRRARSSAHKQRERARLYEGYVKARAPLRPGNRSSALGGIRPAGPVRPVDLRSRAQQGK